MKGKLTEESDFDALWELGMEGLEERNEFIRAYFYEKIDLDYLNLAGIWIEEEEMDWQAEFKKNLNIVNAGKITIAAPWLVDQVENKDSMLIIEPKMAFGTGHHQTTKLALEALSRENLDNKSLLDVGTGSGILAMGAEKLGAKNITAIDIDEKVIPIAQENLEINNSKEIKLMTNDLTKMQAFEYDVLIANLFAELHKELIKHYKNNLKNNGTLILTGILKEKSNIIEQALIEENFTNIEYFSEEDWCLFKAIKN